MEFSGAPQLIETYLAPSETAVLTAVPRSLTEALSASTRISLARGATAETMARSSAVSPAQEVSPRGIAVPPRWSTLRKQPLAVVQAGRP